MQVQKIYIPILFSLLLNLLASCGSEKNNITNRDSWTTDTPSDSGYDGPCQDSTDTDGDTISDTHEGKNAGGGGVDTDGDTVPDYQDTDSDNDGIPDSVEAGDGDVCTPPEDADLDGTPNFRDIDSDGNGIFDSVEGTDDTDHDGKPDFRDTDDDNDGISDAQEIGGNPSNPLDTDGDGIKDFRDSDSDNDTISDMHEKIMDSDGDGIPDYRDTDSDNDGLPDADEAGDTDISTLPVDTDNDNHPDYIDVDSDNDGLSDRWENENGTNPYLEDTDSDGVTDLIEIGAGTDPADANSNPHSEGNFSFIVPYQDDPSPPKDTLVFSTDLKHADVYFLVDTTGSMGGEIDNLRRSISSTVIPGMVAAIPDVQVGVGYFDDYPVYPYGDAGSGDVSYRNLANIGPDPGVAQRAASDLPLCYGVDDSESHVVGLYTVATGDPSRTMPMQPPPSCPAGMFGYPCFRAGSVPVIILISDANFHNGPGNYDPYSGVPAPTYAEVVSALNAAHIKVIGVHSDYWSTDAHYRQLAFDTGTVDSMGNPLVYNIPGDGSGLGSQIINGVQTLANGVPISVSTSPRDDTSDSVDAVQFIDHIEPNRVDSIEDPQNPGVFCLPGLETADTDGDGLQDTFVSVLPGTSVCFDIYPRRNETVPATSEPQVYKAFIDVIGDRITVLDTREVYFLIPPKIEGPGSPI